MTTLSFSLLPGALLRLHDALTCLAKFSDTVSIEAEYDLLRLSTLNTSKTAYSAFAFGADSFFESYSFGIVRNVGNSRSLRPNKFTCQVYLKALLSVFKGRTSGRDKDTAVERCVFELQEDLDETECRLIIKMICGLGVIKSYKLTYESTTIQHAVFDRSKATNEWSIEPKFLKEITDHFSPSAEQLDIYSESTKAIFTSFTTKITDGKEILRQPVHTSVAIDKKDFEYFLAEDSLHVAISLKDFKAVISHAETAQVMIAARYTRPCRPLQLAYEFEGVKSEFTLMTTGEAGPEDISSSRPVPQLSARQTPALANTTSQANSTANTRPMPPPPRNRPIRPLTGTSTRGPEPNTQTASQPPPPSIQFDSLFVPADDDRQWDVPNEDEDEAEDILGWDASADPDNFDSIGLRLRDTEPSFRGGNEQMDLSQEAETGIPPTQRMSQLHGLGLFD
ncbi:DNA repair protein [Aspergillus rambellii]|uniref:DNA repair protein rad9 n=1 Tax=Aspergillus rambellii TaxID=308745 RepID=A0A0F8U5Q5_9EURO|nr:DNA repair protein [Aspergillus rambellii]